MEKLRAILEAFLLPIMSVYCFLTYRRQWGAFIKKNNFSNKGKFNSEQIAEWKMKWKKLSPLVSNRDIIFFSNYCDNPSKVVPENIGHSVIDSYLNPYKYRYFYSDKNVFSSLLRNINVPLTIIRRINGGPFLDEKMCVVDNIDSYLYSLENDKLILKPSVDTDSGIGIKLFKRNGSNFIDENGVMLEGGYLSLYSDNFIIQACIEQSNFMAHLNDSSVNTIRLYVYKSVVDNVPHVVSGVVRIGKNGAYLDNAHAGGRFVGLNVNDGRLGDCTYYYDGGRSIEFNGINFFKEELRVPEWDRVKTFAENVVKQLLHMRYVALDIALTKNGEPMLIEYNIKDSSFWLAMYTNQSPFGDYTNEIIEYCNSKKQKIKS